MAPGEGARFKNRGREARVFCPPVGGTFQFAIFIRASSPGNLAKTIFGVRQVAGGEWGGLFWATSLGKIIGSVTALISFRLCSGMDAAACRAEVCYPFSVGSTGGIGQ